MTPSLFQVFFNSAVTAGPAVPALLFQGPNLIAPTRTRVLRPDRHSECTTPMCQTPEGQYEGMFLVSSCPPLHRWRFHRPLTRLLCNFLTCSYPGYQARYLSRTFLTVFLSFRLPFILAVEKSVPVSAQESELTISRLLRPDLTSSDRQTRTVSRWRVVSGTNLVVVSSPAGYTPPYESIYHLKMGDRCQVRPIPIPPA